MNLVKINDFHANYSQEVFDGEDIKGLNVYAGNTDEKIGSIHDVLVDERGLFRYFVVETGFWIFGKKVLLPVGRCHIDPKGERIQAIALTSKDQVEDLPEYSDEMVVDSHYEERVYNLYRTPNVEDSIPVEMSAPLEAASAASTPIEMSTPVSNQSSVTSANHDITDRYDREPSMYQLNEQAHQKLKLYEERLVAQKNRQQTGTVTVGKQVETKTANVSVPVERERVVVERQQPSEPGVIQPNQANFQAGEVARIEVYEETAEIKKQAFVREEVNIRKEVEQDTVKSQETVRREKLDVDIEGNPTITSANDKE